MLKNYKDLISLSYLALFIWVIFFEFRNLDFNWFVYVLSFYLALGVGAINHNHGHIPIWKSNFLNGVTDFLICVLQGSPVYMFEVAHINSHHRYNQSEKDITRVLRAGDHNHFFGYLIFPIYALGPIKILRKNYIKKLIEKNKYKLINIFFQHIFLYLFWLICFYINFKKTLIFIILPQLFSLHFLLASNYLQHSKAIHGSKFNHSRNFTGLINLLYFNVGYHTAHHNDDQIHWSELKKAHLKISHLIEPYLNQKSWTMYFFGDLLFKPIFSYLKF